MVRAIISIHQTNDNTYKEDSCLNLISRKKLKNWLRNFKARTNAFHGKLALKKPSSKVACLTTRSLYREDDLAVTEL